LRLAHGVLDREAAGLVAPGLGIGKAELDAEDLVGADAHRPVEDRPQPVQIADGDGKLVGHLIAVDARRRLALRVVAVARLHGELRGLHVALGDALLRQRAS
jgi:hypothetical protein